MSIKIGINGFGRIGRLAFRRMLEDEAFEVVAINDLSSAANLAYLLKYDTTHGMLDNHKISYKDNCIIFDGKKIPILGQKDPTLLNWKDYGVDIVLECTGRFKGSNDAIVHVNKGGAKGVVISAPSDSTTPTFVYGVNHKELNKDMKVISGASCTTNALAPVMKVIDEVFGVDYGFMTTVHAYTNDQAILDVVKEKDFRRGRAAASNIIPSSTGAASALHLVLPKLKGKIDGGAIRVPVNDGSLIDLTLTLKKEASIEDINAAIKEASKKELKNVLGYNEDFIVSSDCLGMTYASLFDATQTKILNTPNKKQCVKLVTWYDNEYSYTCQYIRLVKEYAKVLKIK